MYESHRLSLVPMGANHSSNAILFIELNRAGPKCAPLWFLSRLVCPSDFFLQKSKLSRLCGMLRSGLNWDKLSMQSWLTHDWYYLFTIYIPSLPIWSKLWPKTHLVGFIKTFIQLKSLGFGKHRKMLMIAILLPLLFKSHMF